MSFNLKNFTLAIAATFVLNSPNGLASNAGPTPLEEEPKQFSRVAPQMSLQINQIKAGDTTVVAYGGEFNLWYRVSDKWDAGMGLQQVISLKAGGAAVLSNTSVKVRYFLLGGRIPVSRRYTSNGIARIVETQGAQDGIALAGAMEQATFNLGMVTRSYSGVGLTLEYLKSFEDRHLLGLGVGASRISNGEQKLVPMRVQASWQYFLE